MRSGGKRRLKISSLFLAAALFLAACGGEKGQESPPSRESSAVSLVSAPDASQSPDDSPSQEPAPGPFEPGRTESPASSGAGREQGGGGDFSGPSAPVGGNAVSSSAVPDLGAAAAPADKPATYTVRTPAAPGTTVYTGNNATIDASNVTEGYVMIKYSGSANKVKVQITKSGGATYTYNLNTNGIYEVFSFTNGNGSYTVTVLEHVGNSMYAQALGQTIDVQLSNAMLPFLYPNQYVNFSAGSGAVNMGAELARTASTQLEVISNVYNYVVDTISYDYQKADGVKNGTVKSGYLPNVDGVLKSQKGICFDYAAVMTTMLRTQNIPTKLVVGFLSTGEYHAWLNVYTPETGWINGVIYFDGQSWKLMDPTLASSGGKSDKIMKFIGNTANYSAKYIY